MLFVSSIVNKPYVVVLTVMSEPLDIVGEVDEGSREGDDVSFQFGVMTRTVAVGSLDSVFEVVAKVESTWDFTSTEACTCRSIRKHDSIKVTSIGDLAIVFATNWDS